MKNIQQWLISVVLIIVISANASNAITQITTLFKVGSIVKTQAQEIDDLANKVKILEDQVAYAQTDEYKQRALRSLLGLGTQDDYWLLLPAEHSFESVYPEQPKIEAIPNWKKWLNLIVVNH